MHPQHISLKNVSQIMLFFESNAPVASILLRGKAEALMMACKCLQDLPQIYCDFISYSTPSCLL